MQGMRTESHGPSSSLLIWLPDTTMWQFDTLCSQFVGEGGARKRLGGERRSVQRLKPGKLGTKCVNLPDQWVQRNSQLEERRHEEELGRLTEEAPRSTPPPEFGCNVAIQQISALRSKLSVEGEVGEEQGVLHNHLWPVMGGSIGHSWGQPTFGVAAIRPARR